MNQQEQERRARLIQSARERIPDIKDQFEEAQKRHFNSNFEPGGKDAHLVPKRAQKGSQAANTANRPGKGGKNSQRQPAATPVANSQNSPKKAQKGQKSAKSGQNPAQKAQNPPNGGQKGSKKAKKSTPEQRKVNLSVSSKKSEMVHHQRMLNQDVNNQATQHILGVPVNKSRYNGYQGEQITNARLKKMRPDPEAVRIIPLGGTGEFGIGKNMTIIEYKSEMIVVDMGVLFAGADYPGVNYLIPDIKYLKDNMEKVKAICFTHAHLDHIGACKHLLPYFNPFTPIYGTEFTLGMVKRQMSELAEIPDMNYQPVDPLKNEIIKVSEHLSIEFIHVLHSIPGSTAIVVRTPNGVIYLSGDWRHEANPMGVPADYERIDQIVKNEGITLMVNESTNIESPGRHPHSEYDIGDNFGRVMDHYASGRIIISCFSSQVERIQSALFAAAARGRKVAFSGFSMINNIEVALRTHAIRVPKDTIMKMEDIIKLPDEKVTVVCTGSQGEVNAVLNRMINGAHKHIKIKPTDTIVFSSNPIPGNEPHVVSTVDGLLREGAQVLQNGKTQMTNIGPLHLSGHAYFEDHVDLVSRIKPLNYVPYHGEFHMMEKNAQMAENVIGIPRERIIVSDDGDIVELMPDRTIRKNGRIPVGNELFDDADQPVHEAVVKDRIHISREGIFIVVLTLSKKTGRLIKTPDIVSRAFVYLDNSEELIGKIRHYLRAKVEKSISSDPDLKVLKEEVKEEVSHILYDATGHTPIVIPVINKV